MSAARFHDIEAAICLSDVPPTAYVQSEDTRRNLYKVVGGTRAVGGKKLLHHRHDAPCTTFDLRRGASDESQSIPTMPHEHRDV